MLSIQWGYSQKVRVEGEKVKTIHMWEIRTWCPFPVWALWIRLECGRQQRKQTGAELQGSAGSRWRPALSDLLHRYLLSLSRFLNSLFTTLKRALFTDIPNWLHTFLWSLNLCPCCAQATLPPPSVLSKLYHSLMRIYHFISWKSICILFLSCNKEQ